jgi:hypothetical protein
MNKEEFLRYIFENFNLDGTAGRLVDNILYYVDKRGYESADSNYEHLCLLLDGAFGLTDREIKMCSI